MSSRSFKLPKILRDTVARLATGAEYAWTHMGACNCGHLAQTITGLSPSEVRKITYEKPGEWADQVRDYCPTSGYEMDELIGMMLDLGITRAELAHLEHLSDPAVVARMGIPRHTLSHRNRVHVMAYLRAWADLIAEELARDDVKTRVAA